MPFTHRDGVRIYWKLEGAEHRPPLVLVNSLGTDMNLWDAVLPHLLPTFRLLRVDTRGHGASDAPDGDYSMAMLAADIAAVMDAAAISRAVVAGTSLGGMMAMQLALDHPHKVSALALICTSAAMDPAVWDARVRTVREQGTQAIAQMAVERFLSPAFAARHGQIVSTLKRSIEWQAAAGYAGAAAAIRDMRLLERLGEIAQPALVVTGKHDVSTPLKEHGEKLLAGLREAQHIALASAHLAPIEVPDALGATLRQWLHAGGVHDETRTASDALYEAGLLHRRRVLGDDWVDRSLAARTPFNADFQAMITRIAWHEVWARPGLDDRTRRLLVLAITVSLGRMEEFSLHARSGLALGGFSQDELKEVLMQTAIYAGVPAANTAFAHAEAIIRELEREPS